MRDGQIHYDGTPQGLRTTAEGRVWEADEPDPRAARSWMTAEGRYRHVGVPPAGVRARRSHARGRLPLRDEGGLMTVARPRGRPRSRRHAPSAGRRSLGVSGAGARRAAAGQDRRPSGRRRPGRGVRGARRASWWAPCTTPRPPCSPPCPCRSMQRRLLRLTLVLLPALAVWWVPDRVVGQPPRAPAPPGRCSPSPPPASRWRCGPRRTSACPWWARSCPWLWFALDMTVPGTGVVSDVAGWWHTAPAAVVAVASWSLVIAGRRR